MKFNIIKLMGRVISKREKSLTMASLSEECGVSRSVLSRMNGVEDYGVGVNYVEKVALFFYKELYEEKGGMTDPEFMKYILSELIEISIEKVS